MNNKKLIVLGLSVIIMLSVLSVSFVSAFSWSDFFNKITGRATSSSEPTGFTSQGTWAKSWMPKSSYGEGNTFTGDFNGDGKTDIGVYDSVNGNWLVALSTGTGFADKGTWVKSWLGGWESKNKYLFTGDFNGDGKTDIGVYDSVNGNWMVALSSGSLFDASGIWLKSWLSGYAGNIFSGDFNGDGKTDIGVYDSVNGNWLVALSTGIGFDEGKGFADKGTWLKSWLSGYSGNTFTGDFNGDKKTDIGVYDSVNGNWLVALASEPVILSGTDVYSSGGGFTSKGTWIANWLPNYKGNTFSGDFNGDGKTDIGVYDSANGNWIVALATDKPTYCVDTDNGARYDTAGRVYGVESGNAFDKSDECLNSTTIREHYCITGPVVSDYGCPNGCSKGVCAKEKTQTCTESWSCSEWSECLYTNEQARTCTDSNNCGTKKNKPADTQSCVTELTCEDSDDGKNYFVKGNLTFTHKDGTFFGARYDNCDDDFLIEGVCDPVKDYERYDCPGGCKDGACIATTDQTLTCADSDGGKNYLTSGTTTGVTAWWDATLDNVKTYKDYCTTICEGSVGEGISSEGPCLIEYYCGPSSKNPELGSIYAAFSVVKCDLGGCKESACVNQEVQPTPMCTDTDTGKNYANYGEVYDGENKYKDRCVRQWWGYLLFWTQDKIVEENFCENNQRASEQYECPSGSCSGGKCVS